MIWPTISEYGEAIENHQQTLADKELRAGEVTRNAMRLPLTWLGDFAVVYKIHCPATGNTWALKCFIRQIPNLQQRYQIISEHLRRVNLKCMVDFEYLPQGILVRGRWFPVLKMRWVEGQELGDFLEANLGDRRLLRRFLKVWLKLVEALSASEVAHGDLQHRNVLAVDVGGQQYLRLVDYDGMCVPGLLGAGSHECGHSAFQHPERLAKGTYDLTIDRFSQLVIYTTVHCLRVAGQQLWARFHGDNRLLFSSEDFAQPGRSELFRLLWRLDDDRAKALVGRLALACTRPIEQVPALGDIVTADGIRPLDHQQYQQVKRLLEAGQAAPLFFPAGAAPVPGASAPPHATPAGSTIASTPAEKPWWLELGDVSGGSGPSVASGPQYDPPGRPQAPAAGTQPSGDPSEATLADLWYLFKDGAQYGPLTKAELDNLVFAGMIDGSCYLLPEGKRRWRRADEVYPELEKIYLAELVEVHPPAKRATAGVQNDWIGPVLIGGAVGLGLGAARGGCAGAIAGAMLGAVGAAIAWGIGGWIGVGMALFVMFLLLRQ